MTVTVGDIATFLDAIYPPELAESWDTVGLAVGDRDASVEQVLCAVDPVEAVIDEAIRLGAKLIVTHHPLLLRGITTVATDTARGALIAKLIKNDIALFTAHTNADRARDGVNDALAAAVGITGTVPLVPVEGLKLEKIAVFVPGESAEQVIDSLSAVGAGALGNYSRCAFIGTGIGTFRPGDDARPTTGERGQQTDVAESRIEMVYQPHQREAVVHAMREAHPYEEPAFDLLQMLPLPSDAGLGRVGKLSQPVSLAQFCATVAKALPSAPVGIRAAGNLNAQIRNVAVLGGAGDSHLEDARRSGADVFLTADLRHHVVSEHLAAGGQALIDGGHWATEWPWLPRLADRLTREFGDLRVLVSEIPTDPFTVHLATGDLGAIMV
ncbi:MAG: Nif3-like dinuclear metal center hexameric protein [Antricoccus sp.]